MADNDQHQHQQQQRRRGNLRLGLILASVTLVFFVGFIAKAYLLSR